MARMLEAMRLRQVNGKRQAVSLSIRSTKCSQVIDMSTAFRATMGGVYPNHVLSTSDMTKYEIKEIIDKK